MADTVPGRAPARRTVLAGAGLAAGAALVDAPAEAAVHHHGAPLLATPARHLADRFSYGVTPGLARQVRHHGGARRLVRVAAESRPDPRPSRPEHRVVVPAPRVVHTADRGRERQRHGGRLGGHGRLPELAAAPAHAQPASGPGDHDGVLGEPLQRPGRCRRCLHLAQEVRRRHPRPGPGLLRVAAPGRDRPSRDGHLPGERGLRQGAPEREPGPGAARAAHRRTRRRLHREGRRRLRPDPDRVAGRRLEDLGRDVQQVRPLPPAGSRPRLPQPELLARRPQGDPPVPPLPGAPSGHGAPHRLRAGRGVRQ